MGGAGLKVRCLASTRVEDWSIRENISGTEEDGDDLVQAEEKVVNDVRSSKEEDGGHGKEPSLSPHHIAETQTEGSESTSTLSLGLESESESDRSSSESESESQVSSDSNDLDQHVSCFQEVQLSPDGTCVFTSDYNRTFNVYAVDPHLTSDLNIQSLRPYASFQSANPIWAIAANPLFNLYDADTTHVLISRRDSYITLHNALWNISQTPSASDTPVTPIDISTPLSFYKNINSLTEAVTAPLSLVYSHSGTHFFAGLQNSIATFDLAHTSDPIHNIPTIPSARNKLKGGGRGFKGWISALSLSPCSPFHDDGLLAAGSRTRHIGIYDATSGVETTAFALPGALSGQRRIRNANLAHVMGDGVSGLQWSPCGKYLYVAERCSDVLLIYDVRNFSLALGYCVGRAALTKQKLGFDVWNAGASPYDVEGLSHEIWAGGTDGCMRVWRDPYAKEGAVEADEVVQVGEGRVPVVATLVHPSGSLAVAASGSMAVGSDEADPGRGMRRGGGIRPGFREWGRLDILGLC